MWRRCVELLNNRKIGMIEVNQTTFVLESGKLCRMINHSKIPNCKFLTCDDLVVFQSQNPVSCFLDNPSFHILALPSQLEWMGLCIQDVFVQIDEISIAK